MFLTDDGYLLIIANIFHLRIIIQITVHLFGFEDKLLSGFAFYTCLWSQMAPHDVRQLVRIA